jgi:DNA gyrase subunit A
MGTNEDDFVEHLLTTNSHQTILFFTNKGKVYRLKAYEIPELSRTAKGIPLINLLQIDKGEYISTVIPIEEFSENAYLFFLTKKGISKRTVLSAFSNIRKGGLFAINVREDDELHGVRLTSGNDSLIIGTKQGMSIHFDEEDVRSMGRTASGVKAISLREDDEVVGMDISVENEMILMVTNKGYGKLTSIEEFSKQNRGGKGLKAIKLTSRTGELAAMRSVPLDIDLMVMTIHGVVIRMQVGDVSRLGRYAQGVRLIRLDKGEAVSTVAPVIEHEAAEEENVPAESEEE